MLAKVDRELVRVDSQSSAEVRTSEQLIVAGRGLADVTTNRRSRQLVNVGLMLSSSRAVAHHQRRRRQSSVCEFKDGCLAGHVGDIDGDCSLTSFTH